MTRLFEKRLRPAALILILAERLRPAALILILAETPPQTSEEVPHDYSTVADVVAEIPDPAPSAPEPARNSVIGVLEHRLDRNLGKAAEVHATTASDPLLPLRDELRRVPRLCRLLRREEPALEERDLKKMLPAKLVRRLGAGHS